MFPLFFEAKLYHEDDANQATQGEELEDPAFFLPNSNRRPMIHFQNKMICAAGHAYAHTEIEFPLRRDIEIDRGKDLMLLFAL